MLDNYEANQLRKSHRISLPAMVKLGKKEFRVLDWSLEGFKCGVASHRIPEKWSGTVKFVLPLSGMNISFDALATVVRRGEDECGFSFNDLSDQSKMLLKTYLEASVEGKLANVNGIISRVESVEIAAEIEKPLTLEEHTTFKRKFQGRAVLYIFLLLVAFSFVALVLYSNFSKSVSVRGVVSGAILNVSPEVSGYLQDIKVHEGQSVKKGQLLFTVDDSAILREIKEINLIIEVEKEKLALLYTRLSEEERELGLYRNAANIQVEMVEQQIKGVKARINLAKMQFERAEKLMSSGAVSRSFLDERRKDFLTEKAALSELDKELILAKDNALSAKNGKYMSRNSAHGDRQELKGRILVQKKELEVKRFRLVQAMAKLEKTRVTANISGKVYSLKRVPGTYLNEGESVMTLTANDIHPWALARFTFKGALNISQGDAVDVYVPALGKHYQGTIQAMGHYALADSGSEAQSLEVSGSEVPVKIIFDKHPDDLSLGLGVEARVQTNFLNRLHAIITQWSSFEASI